MSTGAKSAGKGKPLVRVGRKAAGPGDGTAELPNSMINKQLSTLLLVIFLASNTAIASPVVQEDLGGVSLPSITSPNDKLHALALTRFHFITLKQFHSALFTHDKTDKLVSESQAQIINAGLNAFLTSAGRETLLLEALRQNKSVALKFSVPETGDAYEVLDHPTKPLLYRLESVKRSVPTTVEIKPFLDSPVAFEITLRKEKEVFHYEVDWAGRITQVS